ncbi:glycosyltransferase family 2 protein [Aureimonas sp. OT7]|uniref:glycosyltransferase family 2 protein n=1 Tax=Aureimonas sp. OT7 TaxID=2816454 RepID=UPI00177E9D94|nr:glycosyltransferase family A protein [Aureimonas sp. OT7]QOG06616.1 glycosyltransferase family 2 protein [Aureimonas sp. OT7]
MDHKLKVAVIIAAMNASATITRAIISALADQNVAEVIVVDDASSDDTAAVARAADDGSNRLTVLVQPVNAGPAAARNRAVDASSSPLIAVLDADDFLLPGRFDALLAEDEWDFAADDILFVPADRALDPLPTITADKRPASTLGAAGFIDGNISRRGRSRGEIGFLKPVMRRSFLEAHGLRYREQLRLGEDYEFYVRALLAGARYKVVHHCGYAAVVRADSLSGRHRTEDLRLLWQADLALLALPMDPDVRGALERHAGHIRKRYELRRFLDEKAADGLVRAGIAGLSRPRTLPGIASGIASDKLETLLRRLDRRPAELPRHRQLSEGWRVG